MQTERLAICEIGIFDNELGFCVLISGFLIGVTFINIIKFCVWSVVDNEMVWRYYLLHLQVMALCLTSQVTLLTQVACHL